MFIQHKCNENSSAAQWLRKAAAVLLGTLFFSPVWVKTYYHNIKIIYRLFLRYLSLLLWVYLLSRLTPLFWQKNIECNKKCLTFSASLRFAMARYIENFYRLITHFTICFHRSIQETINPQRQKLSSLWAYPHVPVCSRIFLNQDPKFKISWWQPSKSDYYYRY